MKSCAQYAGVIGAVLVTLFSVILAGQEGNYYVADSPLSWFEARDYCIELNQKLVSLESVEQDVTLMNSIYYNENVELAGNLWVSATEVSEGVWHWDSTGSPAYHTRWFVGQPDDTANLNCVYLASSALFYWRDANCSAPMYFLCE